MSNTLVTDISHFLKENGMIASASGPARKLAEHIAAIVAESTAVLADIDGYEKVPCRRRPRRRPCVGLIESWIEPDSGAIYWECPSCGDNGLISHWEGTMWDLTSDATHH
jgi:hypothetical protein